MFHDISKRLGAAAALIAAIWAAVAFAAPRGGEEIEAVAGSPFGVGRLTVMLPRVEASATLDESSYSLTDKDGRILYAVFAAEPVRALLREFIDRPARRFTVYFLFTGDAPLTVTLNASAPITRQIVPRRDRAGYDQLLAAWWREQGQSTRRDSRQSDYPQLVNNYVTAMLARRLNLPPPEPGVIGQIGSRLLGGGSSSTDEAVGVFLGTEEVRAAMLRNTMLRGPAPPEPLDQPLPSTAAAAPLDYPDAPADVAIEPMALHVPRECFYVRFGTFANYMWLRAVLDEYAGDLRNMITLRGVDYGNSAHIEHQLALKETPLSRMLGGTVISDVAILGDDTFVREGAAVGIMFQARNSFLLTNSITQQRQEALDQNKTATQSQVDVAGHTVSLLSTPDNSIRSFYAVDGDFHLVTTSKTIVRRFFEAGAGKDSLGASKEFRYARTIMPLSRDDSIFAYLSDAFMRQLVGPAYRVEMTRRLQAVTDLELVQMARLAARGEGKPADTIDQLIAGGYLPPGFGARSDGSRFVADGETLVDSLRGQRGSFLPIADVDVTKVTASEAAAYRDFAQSFRDKWGQTEPIMVGLRRLAPDTAPTNNNPGVAAPSSGSAALPAPREQATAKAPQISPPPTSGPTLGATAATGPVPGELPAPNNAGPSAPAPNAPGPSSTADSSTAPPSGPPTPYQLPAPNQTTAPLPAPAASNTGSNPASTTPSNVATNPPSNPANNAIPPKGTPAEELPRPGAVSSTNRERIIVDLYVAPFSNNHLGMANGFIGPATRQRLAPIGGDAVSLEVSLAGGLLGGPGGPYHLFAGMRDSTPPAELGDQPLRLQSALRDLANLYIGAWPRAGILEFFGYRGDMPVTSDGRGPDNSWQRRVGEFSLLAFQPNVLDAVVSQLQVVDGDMPAQLHLYVGDLSRSKLAGLANTLAYRRARMVSAGNVRFLNVLANQLHIPREQCLAVAERILDAKLVDPLGGEYQLKDLGNNFVTWVGTGLMTSSDRAPQVPETFNPPPMNWFRGLDLAAGTFDNQLLGHAVIDVQHKGQ